MKVDRARRGGEWVKVKWLFSGLRLAGRKKMNLSGGVIWALFDHIQSIICSNRSRWVLYMIQGDVW